MERSPAHTAPFAKGFRWYHAVGVFLALGLLGYILQLFNDHPSIAEVYRPAVARIERTERKRVQQGKRKVTLDFYYATYPAYDMRFPTSFATDTGIYRVEDTVWVLYNPEQPAMNLIYAPRSGAIHLPEGVNLQGVGIDYDAVSHLFDSLANAN